MAEEITTIKILKKDRRWLEALFGQPTHIAFHAVTQLCPHPEKNRIYTTCLVKKDRSAFTAGDALEDLETLPGYLCTACGYVIYRGPRPK